MGDRAPGFAMAFILSAWPAALAYGQDAAPTAGQVKAAAGSATIVRGQQILPAIVGSVVFTSDVLRTGADGAISVMLRDNSRLSIGPGTEIAVAEFQFAPAEHQLSLVLRVVQGVLSYVSGRLAKLAPGSVRIETPTLVIGVRGTHALVKVDPP